MPKKRKPRSVPSTDFRPNGAEPRPLRSRPLPGHADICVNEWGHVFTSRRRRAGGSRSWEPLRARQLPHSGIWYVFLRVGRTRNGWAVYRPHYIRRLVALAFLGEKPRGCKLWSLDRDPSNHSLDNLCYASRAEMKARFPDRFPLDAGKAGEAHPNAQLTSAQVREIRLAAQAGVRDRENAARYGVRFEVVKAIRKRLTWRLQDHDIPPVYFERRRGPKKPLKVTEDEIAEARLRYAGGASIASVHRDVFGGRVTVTMVRHYLGRTEQGRRTYGRVERGQGG